LELPYLPVTVLVVQRFEAMMVVFGRLLVLLR